jgi:hypothetical protein
MKRRRTSPGRVAAILVLGLLGYGLIRIGPVYYREWRFQLAMDKALRGDDASNETFMIDNLIRKAELLGLPPLTPDNFTCDCEPGTEAILQCAYTEPVRFPGGLIFSMKREIEVRAPLPAGPEKTE